MGRIDWHGVISIGNQGFDSIRENIYISVLLMLSRQAMQRQQERKS